jgi:hypothetical protein
MIDAMAQINIVRLVETIELLSATTGNLCKIAENQNARISALEKRIKELEATVAKLKEV